MYSSCKEESTLAFGEVKPNDLVTRDRVQVPQQLRIGSDDLGVTECFRFVYNVIMKKISIPILIFVLVIICIIFSLRLFSLERSEERTPTSLVGNHVTAISTTSDTQIIRQDTSSSTVSVELPQSSPPTQNHNTDACEQYGTEATLSSSQMLECQKKWSIPNEDGYSRFSYHPTKLTLSGTYEKYLFKENNKTNLFTSEGVHFLPDKNEFSKLPISGYLPDDKQINFRDLDAAEISFGVHNEIYSSSSAQSCTLSGTATIEVSEIIIDNFEGGTPLSSRQVARLDKIIKKSPYIIECN